MLDLNELVKAVKARIALMTDEERLALIDALTESFCGFCGRSLANNEVCHCWNDE